MDVSVDADHLVDYASASSREWLVANGIGGYACGSLSGANTRRYHGLLIAAMSPPTGRRTALSRIEETLVIGSARYDLSCNQYPGVVHPEGYRYLRRYAAWPVPTFEYRPAPGLAIVKRIWMADGSNTTYVSYTLVEAPSSAELTLTPLVCWKDHHAEMRAGSGFPSDVEVCDSFVAIGLAGDGPVLRLVWPLRVWEAAGYWHYNVEHLRELERGLDWREDLYCPGHATIDLEPGNTAVVIATLEEGAPPPAVQSLVRRSGRLRRLEAAVARGGQFARVLAPATDVFVVGGARKRARGKQAQSRSAIIAGYPWFTDWGRDSMIALPGLCLATRHYEAASQIILSYAACVSEGMLPNRFPDAAGPAEYNTADATLWFVEAVRQYVLSAPGGLLLAARLWPTLVSVLRQHLVGTRYGIGVDPADGLLRAGGPDTQLTWMDARVEGRAVTPRAGKPVEINALWYNALCAVAHMGRRLGRGVRPYESAARRAGASFREAFARPDGLGLYDVVSGDAADDAVRPSQIFAVSLPFSPLTRQQRASVVRIVERELVTPCGVRTLAPESPAYAPRYEGPMAARDAAYHQGTVWPWLLGPFALAHYRVHGEKARARAFLAPLEHQLTAAAVGYLPEVYDAEPPQRPGGCIAQAWSVAETLRAWMLLR